MQEHPAELDFDCMTMTGRTLHEYADMGWRGLSSLAHLLKFLGPDSKTWQAENDGDEAPAWSTVAKTNEILADVYDAVSQLNSNVVAGFSRKRQRPAQRYPRPNAGKGRSIGRGAVPVSEFEKWWTSGA